MSRKLVLKNILNWCKLLLAIDFAIVAVILPIETISKKQFSSEELAASLAIAALFLLIGLLLLRWFFVTRRAIQGNQTSPDQILESVFFHQYPRFVRIFEGWNLNGFGTMLLTRNSKRNDGSVEAIKWIVLAFMPFQPLYQERILIESETEKGLPFLFSTHKMRYRILERVPLNKKLVRYTYFFYYLFFLPMLCWPLIGLFLFLGEINAALPGAKFWYLIIAYITWGILLLYALDLWNKKFFLGTVNNG